MGHKAARTVYNIKQGIIYERPVQCLFQKFCKGEKNLESDMSHGHPPSAEENQLSIITERHMQNKSRV